MSLASLRRVLALVLCAALVFTSPGGAWAIKFSEGGGVEARPAPAGPPRTWQAYQASKPMAMSHIGLYGSYPSLTEAFPRVMSRVEGLDPASLAAKDEQEQVRLLRMGIELELLDVDKRVTQAVQGDLSGLSFDVGRRIRDLYELQPAMRGAYAHKLKGIQSQWSANASLWAVKLGWTEKLDPGGVYGGAGAGGTSLAPALAKAAAKLDAPSSKPSVPAVNAGLRLEPKSEPPIKPALKKDALISVLGAAAVAGLGVVASGLTLNTAEFWSLAAAGGWLLAEAVREKPFRWRAAFDPRPISFAVRLVGLGGAAALALSGWPVVAAGVAAMTYAGAQEWSRHQASNLEMGFYAALIRRGLFARKAAEKAAYELRYGGMKQEDILGFYKAAFPRATAVESVLAAAGSGLHGDFTQAAGYTIAKWAVDPAMQPYLEKALDPGAPKTLRRQLASALAQYKGEPKPSFLRLMLKVLSDPEPDVADGGLNWVLANVRPAVIGALLEPLNALARGKNSTTRQRASVALVAAAAPGSLELRPSAEDLPGLLETVKTAFDGERRRQGYGYYEGDDSEQAAKAGLSVAAAALALLERGPEPPKHVVAAASEAVAKAFSSERTSPLASWLRLWILRRPELEGPVVARLAATVRPGHWAGLEAEAPARWRSWFLGEAGADAAKAVAVMLGQVSESGGRVSDSWDALFAAELSRADENRRALALDAVGRRPELPASIVAELVALVRGGSADERRAAAALLASLDPLPQDVGLQLASYLGSDDPEVAVVALVVAQSMDKSEWGSAAKGADALLAAKDYATMFTRLRRLRRLPDGLADALAAAGRAASGERKHRALDILSMTGVTRPSAVEFYLDALKKAGYDETTASYAARGLRQIRAPDPALPRAVTGMLSGGKTAQSAQGVLLAWSGALPADVIQRLLGFLGRGGVLAASASSILEEVRGPTDEQKHSLLRAYGRASDPEERARVARVMERWFTATEIVRELWPEHYRSIQAMLPELERMSPRGFERSPLATEEGRREVAASLRLLRRLPMSLQREAISLSSLGDLRPAAVLRLGVKMPRAQGLIFETRIPGVETQLEGENPAILAYSPPAPGSREEAAKVFQLFDDLIQGNFAALKVLSDFAAEPTKSKGQAVVVLVDEMAAAYRALALKGSPYDEPWERIKTELDRAWGHLAPHAVVPPSVVNTMTHLNLTRSGGHVAAGKVTTVHTMINAVHQAAFEAVRERLKNSQGEGKLTIGDTEISFVDLSAKPALRAGRIQNPLLKLLLSGDLRRGTLFLRDDEAWFHIHLGAHSAELHVKLADPDAGGLLRLRYSESGTSLGNNRRRDYIASIVAAAGAQSNAAKERLLESVLDKDHGMTSRAQIERNLSMIVSGMIRTLNLDFTLTNLGQKPADRLIAVMKRELFADGRVTFYNHGMEYEEEIKKAEKRLDGRLALRGPIDEELAHLGLPALPAEEDIGQRLIDERFNLAVRKGLTSGELAYDAGTRRARRAHFAPAAALARAALADETAAARLAAAVESMPEEAKAFEPLGAVGRLSAQRLFWPDEAGEDLVIDVLRDPSTGAVAFAAARRRSLAGGTSSLSESEALEALAERGYAAAARAPSSRRMAHMRRLLAAPPPPPRPERSPLARGLAASAGSGAPAAGPVVFRHSARAEGGVLVAPYTTPDDLELMRRAAAVVATGGGLLSHAAITTRELGIASAILPSGRWRESGGRTELVVGIEEPARAVSVDGLWISEGVARREIVLTEGSFVRVDGRRGTVELLGGDGDDAVWLGAAWAAARRGESESLIKLAGKAAQRPARLQFLLEAALDGPALASRRGEILEAVARAGGGRDAALALVRDRLQTLESELAVRETPTPASHRAFLEERARLGELATISRVPPEVFDAFDRALAALPPGSASRVVAAAAAEKLAALVGRPVLEPEDIRRAKALFRRVEPDMAKVFADVAEAVSSHGRKRQEEVRRRRAAALSFAEIDDVLTPLVGGKTAKLGEIAAVVARHGAEVPGGFGVTTEAYLRFLAETGLEKRAAALAREIDDYLDRADPESPQTMKHLTELSEKMRALLRSKPMNASSGVGREILEQLAREGLEAEQLAVRSSAVQEDRDEAAFAGAAESYLYVSKDEALDKIAQSWASFWLPRGILYRHRQGIRSVELEPAVTVQKMASAKAAGVLFTVNPVTNEPEIVVNAAHGLGEGIVSGLVQADQYRLDAKGRELAPPVIGDKVIQVVRAAGGRGTEVRTVPPALRRVPALTPPQLKKLAKVGRGLEEHFGQPVDVEFAVDGDKLYVLQVRPVTTVATP